MNKVWMIAVKDFQYLLKDKSVLIWMFIMPLVFFSFIGFTTQNFGGSSSEKVTLAIWHEAEMEGQTIDQIHHRLEEENFAIRVFSESQPLYLDKYKFEDYSRKLWLPQGIDETLKQGDEVTLSYQFNDNDMAAQLHEFKINKAVYQTLGDFLVLKKQKLGADALNFDAVNELPQLITLDSALAGERYEIPNGFKQAVPGILVMFIMMLGLTSGAMSLFMERKTGVLRRLAAAPISRQQLIMGKWLGKWFLTLCQLVYGMVMGTLLFDIYWSDHWPMVFVMLSAWAASCAGLAVLFGSLAQNEGQINGIPVIVSMLLAALGGCWWPIEVTPEWMQQLAMFLPTGWVMDALHQLMYFGGDLMDVINHQIALYALALICLWLSFSKFNPDFKK